MSEPVFAALGCLSLLSIPFFLALAGNAGQEVSRYQPEGKQR